MNAFARAVLVAGLVCFAASATAQDWEQCQQAKSDAEDAAGDLASAALSLQSCAQNEDFSDDCGSELSNAESAQDDYEDATGEVQSYCEDY